MFSRSTQTNASSPYAQPLLAGGEELRSAAYVVGVVARGEGLEVGIVGCGFVGLVTGACLSHLGHRVKCTDKDKRRISGLKDGQMPLYEPGLREMASRGVRNERLSFATSEEGLACLVGEADVMFIAVDTPQADDGSADLLHVAAAVARDVGRALAGLEASRRERPLVVATKSTVPVGSGDHVSMLVREGAEESGSGEANFLVASNPEFLREGSAIHDSLFPDRIVAGSESTEASDTFRVLYEPIIEQSFATELDPRPKVTVPFVSIDLVSAEMIKYALNAFLATKVSFINEMANLCELVGADVGEVAYGIGLDGRIGSRFLSAGIGWGGSCFPKDIAALRAVAREYEHEVPLLDATIAVNEHEHQRKRVIGMLQRELHTLKGKRVALLGLSFKPNTDDLREALSLHIARSLDSLGARVVGYDPVASKKAAAQRLLPTSTKVVFDPYEALRGAHAAVVVTEWEEVRTLDLNRVSALMEEPKVLVDGRNALETASALEAGLLYRGFGRRYGLDQGWSQEADTSGR